MGQLDAVTNFAGDHTMKHNPKLLAALIAAVLMTLVNGVVAYRTLFPGPLVPTITNARQDPAEVAYQSHDDQTQSATRPEAVPYSTMPYAQTAAIGQ
jgi:hypothetical protein